MEDFVKYLADIIEFLVGGVLISLAIIVSFALFFPSQIGALTEALFAVPDSYGLLISLGAFALVYGLGVIFEGISRTVVEWRLDRVTVDCVTRAEMPPAGLHGAALTRWAVHQREAWRAIAEADEAGKRAITNQLSRLRVERTFLLTSYIVMIAFAIKSLSVRPVVINEFGLGALLMAVFSVILYNLVNARFKRYVNGIVREHRRLHPASPNRTFPSRANG